MTNTLAPSRVLVTGATSWADREMVERLLAEYADRKSGLGGSFRIITGMADGADAVSYTHLTLPTICSV